MSRIIWGYIGKTCIRKCVQSELRLARITARINFAHDRKLRAAAYNLTYRGRSVVSRTMRLSCNMATGKGLAVIFLPRSINLIGNNKLNKFSCNLLQRSNASRRHVATVASTVGCPNRDKAEKSRVYTPSISPLDYIILCFPDGITFGFNTFVGSSNDSLASAFSIARYSRLLFLTVIPYVPHTPFF